METLNPRSVISSPLVAEGVGYGGDCGLRTAGRSGLSNTLFRIGSCMDGSGDERRKTKPVGAYVFFSGEYTPPSCAATEEAPGWYAKWPKLGSRSEGLIGWLAWLVELGPLPECMLKDHTLDDCALPLPSPPHHRRYQA
jgi:hypothetical protein